MTGNRLLPVLERSKSLGFLGPGPVADHVDHANRFTRALGAFLRAEPAWREDEERHRRPLLVADLGAGGGLPSLPMMVAGDAELGSPSAVLIDASQKRCSFLTWAVTELDLQDRVEVWCGRAEEIAHQERARFRFDVVVARGFGPPAATVECGAPLLNQGGLLCISEPPERRGWPAAGLADVGLRQWTPTPPPVLDRRNRGRVGGADDDIAMFRRIGPVEARYPRRSTVQRRQPLFEIEAPGP